MDKYGKIQKYTCVFILYKIYFDYIRYHAI